jgi:lycopene beta-cyclase
MPSDVDHLMLGAGLASLSLAEALLDRGVPGSRIALVEPLERALDERTFCCFLDDADQRTLLPEDVATTTWRRWRIGTADQVVQHDGARLAYVHVDARDLERRLVGRLEAAGVEILRGDRIEDHDILATARGASCRTVGGRSLSARRVYDSRPGAAMPTEGLIQSFVGQEVTTRTPCFDPTTATLMEFLDPGRFDVVRFLYVLPFSRTRALVEATSFHLARSHEACREVEHELATELTRSLDDRVGPRRVLRSERGHLPMCARLPAARSRSELVTPIGSAAGCLRPATGYGFLPIRRFARRFAARLALRPSAPAPRPFPAWLTWLDAVFLRALTARPGDSAELFLRVARALPGDRFARFLSERPTWLDLGRLLTGLPTSRMVGAALTVPGPRRRENAPPALRPRSDVRARRSSEHEVHG